MKSDIEKSANGVGKHEGSPTLFQNFMNFGPQTAKTGPEFLPTPTIWFCRNTWRPTATLNETALVCLWLRFEAPKDVNLEMLSRRAALSGNTSL